jgi:hypothetical protein
MAHDSKQRIEAAQRSAINGGRIASLGDRVTMPVVHSAESPLRSYLSADSRVGQNRYAG